MVHKIEKKMKIFVMGAGYVGMALIKRLQPHHLIYTSTTDINRVEELKKISEEVILLDKNNNDYFQKIVDFCDAIIILVAPKNGVSYEETYLETANRVKKAIKEAVKERVNPIHLIYTSSTSVYESINEEWAIETKDLCPHSKNAQILLEAEKIYLNSRAHSCIIRLGGIYGPNRELISRARRMSGMVMSSGGYESTNHIHLEDIVSGIEFCLNHHLDGIYNLVNNDHPSRRELYSRLCKEAGIPPPQWQTEESVGMHLGYKVSNEKICSSGFSLSAEAGINLPFVAQASA
jgi:nucleoside-diphosphate-sugar epimerase